MYGLTDDELKKLRTLFARQKEIEQVVLYGSRAKGNYKPFSDVDITLVGLDLTRRHLNQLVADIDESSLPYQFDISIFHAITNAELVEHIKRKGVLLYPM